MQKIRFGLQEVAADALLAALHNGSRAVGMGVVHDIGRDMTRAEAREYLARRGGSFNLDYVCGRPIKVYARDGVVSEGSAGLYDRDNGPGAFARAFEDALTMPESA
jgi:hypothetical protein